MPSKKTSGRSLLQHRNRRSNKRVSIYPPYLSASQVTSLLSSRLVNQPSLPRTDRRYLPTGEAARARDRQDGKERKGPLSSLIYGTQEGKEMDRDIERSFSQVLARGKYVHSIVFHEVKPDKVDEYVEIVGHWYPKIASMPENKVHLVGSWRSEVGDCDTFGKSTHHPFDALERQSGG